MHSHDRTLLAKLGFADRDKQNPLHDLACQYLVQPEQAERLVGMCSRPALLPSGYFLESDTWNPISDEKWAAAENDHANRHQLTWHGGKPVIVRRETERALAKGDGQYKTVVGFIDACIAFDVTDRGNGFRWRPRYDHGQLNMGTRAYVGAKWVDEDPIPFERDNHWNGCALIEVKIGPCSAGDLTRQIKLYREFAPYERRYDTWFAALAFPVTQHFVDELKREGIRAITLGPKFHEWAKAQQSGPAAQVEEL